MSNTYSFLNVQATLSGPGGSINLGAGAAVAQEGITLQRAGDKNHMTIGADGSGMHSLRGDKSGTITVRFLKTAPANAQLMALYNLQSQSSQTWGQNVITVTQTGVGDLHVGSSVAFKKVPDMGYKTDADLVEWVFEAIKIDSLLGTY